MDSPLFHLKQSYHLHSQSYGDEKCICVHSTQNDLDSLGSRREIWELHTFNLKMFVTKPVPLTLISFFSLLTCISVCFYNQKQLEIVIRPGG